MHAAVPHMRQFEVQVAGARLTVTCRHRAVTAPCLVFVHGLGCSQRSFAKAWESEYLDGLDILSLDLPGFGDSTARCRRLGPLPGSGFGHTMEQHAAVVLEVTRQAGIESGVFVGHSMGGVVALLAAARLARESPPPRLLALVNVEGPLKGRDCGVSKLAAGMSLRKFEHVLFPKLLGRGEPLERAFTALELTAPHAFHASARSLVGWAESGRLPEMMRSLPCPACYVYGRRNHSKLSLDALDAVERQAIPDSGHFPMNENPAVFYGFLGAWLKKRGVV